MKKQVPITERALRRNRQSETISTPEGPGVTDNQAPSFEGRLATAIAHGQSNGHAYLLSDPRLSDSANATQKARILRKLQQVHGNRYVQSVAQRIAGGSAGPTGLPHVSRPIQHDNPKRPQKAATVSVLERIGGGSSPFVQLDPVYYGTRTTTLQTGWIADQSEFTGSIWELTRARLGSVIPWSWFAGLWGRSNIVEIHRTIAAIPELPGGTTVALRVQYRSQGRQMEDASLTFTLLNEAALRRRSRQMQTEPETQNWAIRLRGGGGVGGALAGEVQICEICDRETGIGTAFQYQGAGGGLSVRASVSSGVGPSSWQYVTTARPTPLSAWTGRGSVTSSGFGAGGLGVGSTVLSFHRIARWNRGRVVDVEFSSAPTFINIGFSATTGLWVMNDVLYPMPV